MQHPPADDLDGPLAQAWEALDAAEQHVRRLLELRLAARVQARYPTALSASVRKVDAGGEVRLELTGLFDAAEEWCIDEVLEMRPELDDVLGELVWVYDHLALWDHEEVDFIAAADGEAVGGAGTADPTRAHGTGTAAST